MPLTKLSGLQIETPVDISAANLTGITTATDLNATRINVTGVGTISNGSITNLTGTSSTITTFTSTNGSITNLTGTSSTITTLRSTTLNADTGNIVTGVTTNFNTANVVITGVTTVSAGTTALPSISPSGDPNTGIFFPSADTISVSTGGTSRVQINSSGNINIDNDTVFVDAVNNRLGIGTLTPDASLHINRVGDGTYAQSLSESRTKSGFTVNPESSGSSTRLNISKGGGGDLINLQVTNFNGATAFKIALNPFGGNVAVGHTNPGGTLDIKAAAATAPLIVQGASSEFARIDSSGRLLIGTSSVINNAYGGTTGLFQVSNNEFLPIGFFSFTSTAAEGYCPYLELNRARGTKDSPTIVSSGDELGEINFYGHDGSTFRRGASIRSYVDATAGSNDMPARLSFHTSADGSATPTERMMIASTGKTTITAAVAGGAALIWENTVNSSGVFAGVSFLGSNANNTSSYHYIANTGGADKFYVFGNGNVVNVNNSYGSLSDLKIKENIIDATSQWSDIKNLQVRKYNFKKETGHQTHIQIGLIAQEVELISPGLVNESPDRDAEGNELGTVTKSVNYSVLYMKAVKALQEAMGRIEQLESAVASLQGN